MFTAGTTAARHRLELVPLCARVVKSLQSSDAGIGRVSPPVPQRNRPSAQPRAPPEEVQFPI